MALTFVYKEVIITLFTTKERTYGTTPNGGLRNTGYKNFCNNLNLGCSTV
jgi:hypothetical protein